MRCRCGVALAALMLTTVAGEDRGGGWEKKTKDDGRVVQELKIEAPTLTEEDQYGYNMPDRYRCDSCKAVVFHLDEFLKKGQPKSRRLKAWEYTDLFDETCRSGFKGYGVKLIDGVNALSGPGLKQPDHIAPGGGMIQMGGESWEKRLGEICRKLVYEKVGEEELYEKFRASNQLSQEICFTETSDCKAPKLGPEEPKAEGAAKKADKTRAKRAKGKPEKRKDAAPGASPAPKRAAPPLASAPEARVGVDAFLRSMAVKRGLPADEYIMTRTDSEWEQLIVSLAGHIFTRRASGPMSSVAV